MSQTYSLAVANRLRCLRVGFVSPTLGAAIDDAVLLLEIQSAEIARLRGEISELSDRTPTGLEGRGA